MFTSTTRSVQPVFPRRLPHAVIDGIRTFFTEATNPDVLAFHEAFADLTALFLHFSHKDALTDTICKTGGRLYQYELTPDTAPAMGSAQAGDAPTRLRSEDRVRNPLVELAQQFGQASGMSHGLRAALDDRPDPTALHRRIKDPHYRGSILVAAVFDAFFSTYMRASSDLFRIFRAGGASIASPELPTSLAKLLTETATRTSDEFFQLCARALDYCPPVDITFGDFLRALITASVDLRPEADRAVRQALMQAFRVRGIYPDGASFFSEDALCWPRVTDWTLRPEDDALPPVAAEMEIDGQKQRVELKFVLPGGRTREVMNLNGDILREYALQNAKRLGFDPKVPPEERPYAPSFHQTFRIGPDGRLLSDMVVEIVQTRRVLLDPKVPAAGSFLLRGGVTLIVAAPTHDATGHAVPPTVRFAIRKPLIGPEGQAREERQRRYAFATGLAQDDRHFQADFNLLHGGA